MKHPPQEPDVVPGPVVTGVGIGVVIALGLGVVIAMSIGSCRSRQLGHVWVPPLAWPEIKGDINAMATRPFSVEAQGLAMHQREEARLHGYGWIDRSRRIVHVPIDVAIDLYLKAQPGGGT
jgi:hypothetical protein